MTPLTLAASLLAMALAPPPAPPGAVPRTARQVQADAMAAFDRADYAAARDLLTEQTRLDPADFVPRYNLACALSQLGQLEPARTELAAAIALGYDDLPTILADEHLAPLRESSLIDDLPRRWPEIAQAHRELRLLRDAELCTPRHQRRTLDALRLELLSDHDATSTDDAAAELSMLADWFTSEVFADAPDPAENPWATIVLPGRPGFVRWQRETFGPDAARGFATIGGAYDHDRKRLVSMDLGATLRHEFVHVLHWRDVTRRRQTHALWIQEGLAALAEDYDPAPSGPRFVPSWRTNVVKRLLDAGHLPTIADLAAMNTGRFSASRPLANYAHARAVFLFLDHHHRVADFYRAYAADPLADPSGLAALRSALALDSDDAVEARFRDWVRALPMVPETGSDLHATLGVDVESGTGDGPVVVSMPLEAHRRTGLALGSVITHVNDRPTRDLHELIRVLADYAPGSTVTLRSRRGTTHLVTQATLLPRP